MLQHQTNGTGTSPDDHLTAAGEYIWLVACVLSLVGNLFVIGSYLRYKGLRRHPNSLVASRCLCDVVFYIEASVLHGMHLSGQLGSSSPLVVDCSYGLSFVTEFSNLAAELYFLMLSVDLYLSLVNPFSNYKSNTRKYHAVVFALAALAGLVVQGSGAMSPDNYLHVCWIKHQDYGSLGINPYYWAIFYLPLVFILILSVVFLWLVRRRIHAGLPSSARARVKAFRHSMRYLVGFFPFWVTCAVLLFLWLRVSSSDVVYYIFVLFFGARGLVTALLWMWTNERSAWTTEHEAPDVDLSPALNAALKREVMEYTSAGVTTAVRCAGSAALPVDMPVVTRSARSFDLYKPNLQLEQFTVRSMIFDPDEAVDVMEQPREISRSRLARPASLRRMEVSKPLLGSGRSSRRAALLTTTSTTGDQNVEAITLTQAAPERVVKGYLFQDYDAGTFAIIRQLLGISDDAYVNSMLNPIEGDFSGGASGAFMYFSGDRQFIVKTLEASEVEVLRSLLQDYVTHLRQYPNTLLSKFVGCYSIRMYSQTLYFVVMLNVFNSGPDATAKPIDDKYDLKGSRIARNAEPPKSGTLAFCKNCKKNFRVGNADDKCSARVRRHDHVASQTLKDNDLNFRVRLGGLRAKVVEQLTIDSEFLCKHNIMDYSLLLGVHRHKFSTVTGVAVPEASASSSSLSSLPPPPPGFGRSESIQRPAEEREEAKPERPSVTGGLGLFTAYYGGVPAAIVEGPEVYFIGMVDILQEWNWSKKAERWFKVYLRCLDAAWMSAVPPVPYQERFVRFLADDVFEDEEGLQTVVETHGSPPV